MHPFFDFLKIHVPAADAAILSDVERCFTYRHLAKGEALIKSGQINRNVYYVASGMLRNYFMKDGRDITTWFFFQEEFITTFSSFQLQTPSIETSVALTGCDLYSISFEALEALNKSSHTWEHICRIFTVKFALQQESRLLMLHTMTAAEKYHHLLTNYPTIVQNIPNKYISSYLGITRETLSRIRAKRLLNQ